MTSPLGKLVRKSASVAKLTGLSLMLSGVSAHAMVTITQADQPLKTSQPVQFVVKFKPAAGKQSSAMLTSSVKHESGLPLNYVRAFHDGYHVIALDRDALNKQYQNGNELLAINDLAKRISASSHVEYAVPDYILSMQMTPNVSEYDKQWDLYEEAAGINAPAAWDVTTGSKDVVVGIIDTGIVKHENFTGEDKDKLLPGYSFVRHSSDNTDDGVDTPSGKKVYHGTHVAGTIGAAVNANNHIAGIAWDTRMVPVQVLGSNGSGSMTDIIDGMRWAAGLHVDGAPENKNPAKVINMSLGGQTLLGCMLIQPLQQAIDEIVAKGTSIVVAAGNGDAEGNPQEVDGWMGFVPASCNNVITVASVGRDGTRAFYSNYGAKVAIAAPGGDMSKDRSNTENGIYSTTAKGKYEYYQGTSMASPHVAGVAALMLAANPSLTPYDVRKGLTESARAFPSDSQELSCSKQEICGAGMLDASQAVQYATAKQKDAA